MKKFFIIVLIFALVPLYGCSFGETTTSTERQTITVESTSLSDVYFAMIQDFYSNMAINYFTNQQYMAFDFSKINIPDKSNLENMAQQFAEEKGLTYLEGTFDELKTEGYLVDVKSSDGKTIDISFDNGALITLNPTSTSESLIICDISVYKQALTTSGNTYTATLNNSVWSLIHDQGWNA